MTAPRIGSICSGVGGLDEAVKDFFGGELAWFFEYDEAPSKVLAYHYPDVPNYGDITKADWAGIEQVDILCGGTPCQDLSAAGSRKGMTEGTRSNLWVQMREAIAVQRPSVVVWENVRGAYSARADSEVEREPGLLGSYGPDRPALRAFGRVLGDLSSLGYDAEWVGLRAADAGAPHNRFRVFCVAYPYGQRHEWAGETRGWRDGSAHDDQPAADPRGYEPERRGRARDVGSATGSSEVDGEEWQRIWDAASYSGPVAADSSGIRGHEGNGATGLGGEGADWASLADERSARSGGTEWGVYHPAITRWEEVTGRTAPPPTNPDGKNGSHRLSPEFVNWMMGWPAGWVTDPAIGLTRNEQLKACGNGVVTAQALLALETMRARHVHA